jgi:hypothetical protein
MVVFCFFAVRAPGARFPDRNEMVVDCRWYGLYAVPASWAAALMRETKMSAASRPSNAAISGVLQPGVFHDRSAGNRAVISNQKKPFKPVHWFEGLHPFYLALDYEWPQALFQEGLSGARTRQVFWLPSIR